MYYPQSEPLNCCYIVSWCTCTSFMAFFSKVLIVVSTVLQSSTKLFLFLYLHSLTPFLTASGIYVPTKTVYITNPPSTFTLRLLYPNKDCNCLQIFSHVYCQYYLYRHSDLHCHCKDRGPNQQCQHKHQDSLCNNTLPIILGLLCWVFLFWLYLLLWELPW